MFCLWLYRPRVLVRRQHSPGSTSTRCIMAMVGYHHANDRTSEDDDGNDQADYDRDPVFPKAGGLLSCVHNRRAATINRVIRLHNRARGCRIVAVELVKVADGLWHRFDRDLGRRVRYRLGVLGEAAWTALGGRVVLNCFAIFILVGRVVVGIARAGVGHGQASCWTGGGQGK